MMIKSPEKSYVLLVDDDEDDQLMLAAAFKDTGFAGKLHLVSNGEDLMNELHEGISSRDVSLPDIILLDLNMPKKDGRASLREIKKHPLLCRIPVIVCTTSKNPDDIAYAYDNGANSYITKPSSYTELKTIVQTIQQYWLSIAVIAPVNVPVD